MLWEAFKNVFQAIQSSGQSPATTSVSVYQELILTHDSHINADQLKNYFIFIKNASKYNLKLETIPIFINKADDTSVLTINVFHDLHRSSCGC